MAHQSPTISIPKKTTEEVDWTTPIRTLIAQSYGENPDNYAAECAALQRCRQDAVRGAGSDFTARDLLYKYFGQLELLELRFAEIRVNFPWHDAFTNKLVTQTSIAYEKASILFQIAVTHSAIAASQNRSDPEGLKRAFYYFRTCAGMLTYINENFLHAPSTDLSRDVVKFLVNLILAQASEVFFEKCTDEKKGSALVSKVGSQVASMYNSLSEEVKEFMGKGILDRNWVTLIQIKAKYFTSLAQYYRGLADASSGKHGDALVRFTVAEAAAKEAARTAASFSSLFVTNMSPNLPADAGSSIHERTKAHLALCTERRGEAQRENDLIYNEALPAAEALAPIDKAVVATPIPIQEVYGTPDVQKVIGPDLFLRLIPLSVHESASVYSEEKAKLVRGEVEKAESAEVEARSALEALGIKEGLVRFKAMAEGEVGDGEDVPVEVRRWRDDIQLVEERESVDSLMGELTRLKDGVRRELEGVSRDLEIESKDCEMMRVKYEHRWTQAPSASLTKNLRQDLKAHLGALDAASASDQQVGTLWDSVRGDIALLLSPGLEQVFRASASTEAAGESLLDLDVGTEVNDQKERARIGQFVEEIEERIGRLEKIGRERQEVLKDLKEKIQTDDVSHLLLLNRRNTGVEPTLFAAELEKFRPYQQRLAATVHHQQVALQDVSVLWKGLRDLAGRGPGARKWDEREKRKRETVRRFERARDGYMEVRDGLAKGLQFYRDLTDLGTTLRQNAKSFVTERNTERASLSAQISLAAPEREYEKPPRPPPPPASAPVDAFANMSIRSPPPHQSQYGSPPPSSSQIRSPPPPAPSQWQQQPQHSTSHFPPPPAPPQQSSYSPQPSSPYAQPPTHSSSPYPPASGQPQQSSSQYSSDPYAALGMFANPNSGAPSAPYSTPPPPPPSQYQPPPSSRYQSPPPPPSHSQYQSSPQSQYQYQSPPPGSQYQQPPPASQHRPSPNAFPPPPPPISYQSQYASPPPPQGHGQQWYAPQQR
ncbi:hypothetical protein PLICRDRAFT_105619 [Plicaturopsis crispa FD-325 SS-3]|nr:hypothetical protein PLICRDRAFT_105619 [Plicaturopsis crispa FD-325 SS-3]